MWSLEHPGLLVLLLLLPGMIYFVHFRKNRGGILRFSFSVWSGRSFSPKSTMRKVLRTAAHVGSWLGLVLLIFALAEPVVVRKERHYLTRGIDMIIALDASPSMSARDSGQGSRFDSAKSVIRGFVGGRENDFIGLVTFGKEAALRVPPTLDYPWLTGMLDTLQIMELGDGTAIGMGLAVATVHLNSNANERVIVLMTDGDNNAGSIHPVKAAHIAANLGIRVYTIGIGREGETTLEFTNPETGEQIKGVYQGKFNAPLLKEIAGLTGGRYFQAGSLGTLETIFAEIDTLEKTEQEITVTIAKEPRYLWFVLLGVVCLLLTTVIRIGVVGEVML